MGLSLIGVFEISETSLLVEVLDKILITFILGYVLTVRNLFDWLAKRSRKVFVQSVGKRNSEVPAKRRVSFFIERF